MPCEMDGRCRSSMREERAARWDWAEGVSSGKRVEGREDEEVVDGGEADEGEEVGGV